jgi:hypothetical protein
MPDPKRHSTEEDRVQARKATQLKYDSCRMNIGGEMVRWKRIVEEKGLSNVAVARLLLDW